MYGYYVYRQSTGEVFDAVGRLVGVGYSGHGVHKNVPADEWQVAMGPIPRGLWYIGPLVDHIRLGPKCIPLSPAGHDGQGRSGFFIHGDSRSHPGEASSGCVILSLTERLRIASGKYLIVID